MARKLDGSDTGALPTGGWSALSIMDWDDGGREAWLPIQIRHRQRELERRRLDPLRPALQLTRESELVQNE